MYADELLPPSQLEIEISEEIETILMKAMAVGGEQRYQGMSEFRDAIKTRVGGSAVIIDPVNTVELDKEARALEVMEKRKLLWMGVIGLLLLTLGGTIIYKNGGSNGKDAGSMQPAGLTVKSEVEQNNVNGKRTNKTVVQAGDWIYYLNYLNFHDDHKLYKIKTDGGNRIKLNDDKNYFFDLEGDWIYYQNFSDEGFKLYKFAPMVATG